jgi:hypothetical protein
VTRVDDTNDEAENKEYEKNVTNILASLSTLTLRRIKQTFSKCWYLCYNCIFMYLLYVYIFIVCLCIPSATLTEVFPCFFLSCRVNARVKPAKMGHGPHSS